MGGVDGVNHHAVLCGGGLGWGTEESGPLERNWATEGRTKNKKGERREEGG